MKHIAFYISGHGYGHAVRESVLINALPQEWQISVISSIPQQFFEEELTRPFIYREGAFDCGAIQKDAITVDIEATLKHYALLAENNCSLSDEVRWVQESKIDLIVADVVPYAAEVAHAASIPSIGIGNFTWFDIYKPYVADHPQYQAMLDGMEKAYRSFTHWISLAPENEFVGELSQGESEVLFRCGSERSREIRKALSIPSHQKIVLLYVGNYGMDRVAWERLSTFGGYYFLSFYPLPIDSDNYQTISKAKFTLQEFSASADLIITKLGYGTVTESLSSGVPLLYIPRTDFAEHPYLERFIQSFGGVESLSDELFCSLQMREEIDRLTSRGKREQRLEPTVGSIVTRIISVMYNSLKEKGE